MPRKKSTQPSGPGRRDIPRVGFTCGLYLDGHNVHYIPVTQLAKDRESVNANLNWTAAHLVLDVAGAELVVHNHNQAGIRLILRDLGPQCRWYPSLHLACWSGQDARHWVSLSATALEPCTTVEQSLLDEESFWS